MIGAANFCKLSNSLVSLLHNKGVVYLAQIGKRGRDSILLRNWNSALELGIIGELQAEWESYIIGLKHYGSQLTRVEDILQWSWNDINGEVTSNMVYDALLFDKSFGQKKWWYYGFWKWHLPLKIKL